MYFRSPIRYWNQNKATRLLIHILASWLLEFQSISNERKYLYLNIRTFMLILFYRWVTYFLCHVCCNLYHTIKAIRKDGYRCLISSETLRHLLLVPRSVILSSRMSKIFKIFKIKNLQSSAIFRIKITQSAVMNLTPLLYWENSGVTYV